jgi:hypothetical protein
MFLTRRLRPPVLPCALQRTSAHAATRVGRQPEQGSSTLRTVLARKQVSAGDPRIAD